MIMIAEDGASHGAASPSVLQYCCAARACKHRDNHGIGYGMVLTLAAVALLLPHECMDTAHAGYELSLIHI